MQRGRFNPRGRKSLYQYPLLFEGAAGAGILLNETQILPVAVQLNHWFIWTHLSAHCTVGSGAGNGLPFHAYQPVAAALAHDPGPPSWPVRIQIQDASSQENLQQAFIPLSCIAGNQVARQLSIPRLWQPNSTIQVSLYRFAAGQLTEAGTAATTFGIRVHLVFEGYRVFHDESLLSVTE